jgi:tRNA G26 N,N-dimethylase Trm1
MNAWEANQKALSVNTEAETSQYAKIIQMIKDAAGKGEYEVWFYSVIKEDVRGKLIEQGYDVCKTQFEPTGTMTKIKWYEARKVIQRS